MQPSVCGGRDLALATQYAAALAGRSAGAAGVDCQGYWPAGQELAAPRGGAISVQTHPPCEAASAYGLQGVAGA